MTVSRADEIDELVGLLRETTPPPSPHDWRWADWLTWRRIQLAADHLDVLSAQAANTRPWNPRFNLLGVFGEWVYGETIGTPLDLERKAQRDDLRDGGEDFPGVDVKATERTPPLLMRLRTDPLHAPYYVLVQVDLDGRQGRYLGCATRAMLDAAPDREYGYGPTRTLDVASLLRGLPR